MKIVTVEAGIVSVPLQGTFISAHGALQSQSGVLVRICDDEGGVGWGGVDPIPGYSAVSAAGVVQDVNAGLGPALIGSDPGNVLGALHHMDRCLEGGFEAKAAVETALIDLKGKRLGVTATSLLRSTLELLGGAQKIAAGLEEPVTAGLLGQGDAALLPGLMRRSVNFGALPAFCV